MNEKWIIIHVCSEEQAHFFLRFISSGNKNGYAFSFLTYTYSVYRFLHRRIESENKVYFINRHYYHSCTEKNFKLDEIHTLECITKYVSKDDAYRAYYAAISILEKLGKENISYIWCWNGCKIVDAALSDFAKKYSIKTLFFEIANIDGKIFVDPMGTNARSFLYLHPKILSSFHFNQDEYIKWRENYIKSKFSQVNIKQAKPLNIRKGVVNYLWDDYGFVLKNGVVARQFPRVTLKKKLNHIKYQFTRMDFSTLKYVFFPLQVSSDTQILINGNVTLFEAIHQALEYAKKKDCYLVIKPHPAERDPLYLNKMHEILDSYSKIIFSNENTFLLLKNAEKVFTINSTVGLEALILDRPVYIFGRALYEQFSKENISQYIMGYLIDVDYWGDCDISNDDFLKILARADFLNLF